MLVLTRSEIEDLITLNECVDVVEAAFRVHGLNRALPGTRRHVPSADGGFHIALGGTAELLSVKVNAHFPPRRDGGRSRMGGVIYIADAGTGEPVALLDSRAVTVLRTAAATTVALRHLARRDARAALLLGAGRQAKAQLQAIALALPPGPLAVWDRHFDRAEEQAAVARELGFDARPVADARAAAREADVIVTATPARAPLLFLDDIQPGTTIAAIGADQPGKQELDPLILERGVVVVDIAEQCLSSGEVRAAVAAGSIAADADLTELGQVVAGERPGRTGDDQIIVFDSTGTGLQDAAAAQVVVDAARRAGRGRDVAIFS